MGSPHSGHSIPGSHAPGMYPQLRQIDKTSESMFGLSHYDF